MKITSTSARLKELMSERKLRQIDILNAAKPYCAQLGIKLEKNDLSQYVNGKVEPGQEKLTILGLALDVSETWLMGYDVPISRDSSKPEQTTPTDPDDRPVSDDEIKFALFGGDGDITDAMYEEVKQFAAMVKLREDTKKKKE